MKLAPRPKRRTDDVNIGPLIDMVFILLIFFAVSTTFAKDLKLDLKRPGATQPGRASTKSIRVYMDRTAMVYVDEQPVKPYMVQSRVRDLLRSATSKKVLVVTDEGVPSGKLITLVDQCKLGGADEVAVATELRQQ